MIVVKLLIHLIPTPEQCARRGQNLLIVEWPEKMVRGVELYTINLYMDPSRKKLMGWQ